MQKTVKTALKNTRKRHQKKRILRSIVTTLAAMVVFFTTYALIIPAITWEKTLICELPEHVHTDNCYASDGRLKCRLQEHKHTDKCFDAAPATIKGYDCGFSEHTHSASCYFEDGRLKCTIPEHTHTKDCEYYITYVTAPKFLAGGSSTDPRIVDPDTSNLLSMFKKSTKFTDDYDGMVLTDKTVKKGTGDYQFDVTLSALGQSYDAAGLTTNSAHPDIVFVVDLSSSMATDPLVDLTDNSKEVSRLSGVVDALNYTIGKMLKADPECRIGIVCYGEDAKDGSGTLEKGLYLPLATYKYMPDVDGKAFQYILISDRSVKDWGSYKNVQISFNENMLKADNTKIGTTGKSTTNVSHGTHTQKGLLAGYHMFETGIKDVSSTNRREPVLILISDGEPRSANKDVEGTKKTTTEDESDLYQTADAEVGYWTIRTAIDVKKNVIDLYEDKGSDLGMLFFSIGPGVTSLYGQTILSPGGYNETYKTSNLEACKTVPTSGNYNHKDLYSYLMDSSNARGLDPLDKDELPYSDFANWTISGELTPTELQSSMASIIASIWKAARPIVTTTDPVEMDIISDGAYLTFVDYVGEGMDLVGEPSLAYGTGTYTLFEPTSSSTGTLSSSSDLFPGCKYTLYRYAQSLELTGTNELLAMSKAKLYVVDQADGSKAVVWQFPAELLPVITHKVGDDAVYGTDDDVFIPADPLRAVFTVGLKNGKYKSGEVYYSNDPGAPAEASFEIVNDNPYYHSSYTDYNEKSGNNTKTEEYSTDYTLSGKSMSVKLGNNGKFRAPYDLYVRKIWTDSNPKGISSITAKLYRNGVATGQSVTLNSANGWIAKFENLDQFDSLGNEYTYTVKEDPVPQYYTVSGDSTAPSAFTYNVPISVPVPAKWEKATTMTAGSTYRIRVGNIEGNVLKDNGSSGVTTGTASGGTTDTSEQWIVVDVSGTLRLKNVKSGNYLGLTAKSSGGYHPTITYSLAYSTDADTKFEYSDQLKLTRTSGSYTTSYYLKIDGTSVKIDSNSDNGSKFVVEKLIPATTTPGTDPTEVLGFTLTNTPIPDTIDIEKKWEGVPTTMQKEVTLRMYEKTASGVATYGSPIILNASENWKKTAVSISSFEDEKTYYLAEDDPGGVLIYYEGGTTTSLTYNGKTFTAVEIVKNQTIKVTVTNVLAVDLPSTGSVGITILYMSGALLMIGALTIGCILWRRREGRGK